MQNTMAMSEKHCRVLEESRVVLVKDLNPDDVLDYLIADKILVPDDLEKIESMTLRKDKVRCLLDLMPRRGDKAMDSFMRALRDQDSGHHHLYELIHEKLQDADQPGYPVRHAVQYTEPGLGEAFKCTESNPNDNTDSRPHMDSMQARSSAAGYDYAERCRNAPRSPDEPLSDKLLSELSAKLGKEWEQLAARLGLSPSDIYKCKMENQFNLWGQINAALIKWRNKEHKKATIGILVRELQMCDVDREVYEFLMEA